MKIRKRTAILLILSACIIFSPFILYFLAPSPNIYHPNEVVFKNHDEEDFLSTIQNRNGNYIDYKDIDERFISFLLQIEDKDFFTHKGYDISRIFSSFLHNLRSSSKQGASTITMQLARLLYLNQDQTIERKIEELLIAIKLENKYSKEKILEAYINNVYFAHGIYGIANASKYYFDKATSDLSIKECAILIGVINAPNLYSPYIDLDASNRKVESVLRTLRNASLISIEEYYDALYEKTTLVNHDDNLSYIYPYYVDSIKEELNNIEISNTNINQGISITTYLQENIQQYIESLISSIDFNNSNVAVVVMKPNSGEVISLVGGKDYNESSFNRAKHAKKQIGSTIKPLLYYLALRKGLTPTSEFLSTKTTFKLEDGSFYEVSNASNIYAERKITLIEAIAMSDNIYAMKTMLLVKKENLINLLKSFNVSVDIDNVTLALGSNSLTLLELTSIYNTIASNGLYYKPSFIKKISTLNNHKIYTHSNSNKRLLDKKTCAILQYLLRAPFDKALKSYASPSLLNYYVSDNYGGKTGSTDSSSYVIGFSKNYTIGVYLGSDDNSPITNSYISKEIFHNIATFLDEKNEGYFPIPSSLSTFSLYNTLTNTHSFTYIY